MDLLLLTLNNVLQRFNCFHLLREIDLKLNVLLFAFKVIGFLLLDLFLEVVLLLDVFFFEVVELMVKVLEAVFEDLVLTVKLLLAGFLGFVLFVELFGLLLILL